MAFILHVHPVSQLDKYLKNGHNHQKNDGKGCIDAPCLNGCKRNECQDDGEYKHNDMLLRSFCPVTMFHRLLITLILYRHVLTHLSEQVDDRKDKHPDHVNKVPVHCGDVYLWCSYDR